VGIGEEAAERAVALSPSFALGHLILGAARLYSGQPKEALDAFAHGFRLSPFDPQSFTWHLLAALAQYFSGHPEAAVRETRRSLALRPRWSSALKVALAAHVALGQSDLAASTLSELQHESDIRGDMLSNFAKHQPRWAAQIEAAVADAAIERHSRAVHL
jgi:adenylate cyclase